MLIVVKEAKVAWRSPDAQRTIYEIKDQDGNTWQTMSHKIGNGVGQSFECSTRVSNTGKTYLTIVGQEDGQTTMPVQQAAQPAPPPQPASQQVAGPTQAFVQAVARFEAAVTRLEKVVGQAAQPVEEAPKDVVPTDVDPETVAEFFGGEVIDNPPTA